MEESTEKSVSFSLINLSKTKLLGQIYSDLAQPSVQKVGKALGTVFELTNSLVTPIWMLNEFTNYKKEVFLRNMEKLREKVNEIPEENVCEVPPEIGVPIMEKLTYTTNDNIREAYLNLLTKASSSETALLAHPAFVGLIDKISTDEARIIEFLKSKDFIAFINYKFNLEPQGFVEQKKFATGIELDLCLDFPNNINVYFDNLINIGVIDYQPGIYKLDEKLYNDLKIKYSAYELELSNLVKSLEFAKTIPQLPNEYKDRIPQYRDWSIDKGYFQITNFGKMFIKACTNL